jgi:tetratricopeptide (TPR) repeat protein
VLAEAGKLDEAQRYAEDAVAADPLVFLPRLAQAIVRLLKGRPKAALEQIRDARNRFAPGEPFAGWWVAQAAAYAGDETEAHAECSAVARMDGGLFTGYCELFRRALEKDCDGVLELLDDTTLTEPAKTDEMYPLFLANTMAHIGEYDTALDWLGRSINWGFSNYRFLTEYNHFLAPLREDQRFRNLMKLAQEKQESLDVS